MLMNTCIPFNLIAVFLSSVVSTFRLVRNLVGDLPDVFQMFLHNLVHQEKELFKLLFKTVSFDLIDAADNIPLHFPVASQLYFE